MSDMLSIGLSSLKAYQTALTTVSENIASAGTAGYSRRTTDIREVVAPAGITTGTAQGMGVVARGLTRAADVYKTAEVRTATADLAKTEAGATWLQRVEESLTGSKLGDRLTGFFNSAKAVAADPASLAPRAAMLEAAAGGGGVESYLASIMPALRARGHEVAFLHYHPSTERGPTSLLAAGVCTFGVVDEVYDKRPQPTEDAAAA